ncbi:hypothetical protein Tdes44962_MAKER07448 [Teratosphaeria destructans]|uniref:Uncharacterized protein n=1 Tax=Teratosphaeria destructans TaxID=418781 RepID=A0A9W7SYS1_9PEZI|nr:hypothetical protein Tdes44962_MAKER07448 [Teratosphaeria destructans]
MFQAVAQSGAVASGNGVSSSNSNALAGGLEKYPCGNPIPGACSGGLPPVYYPPFSVPQQADPKCPQTVVADPHPPTTVVSSNNCNAVSVVSFSTWEILS